MKKLMNTLSGRMAIFTVIVASLFMGATLTPSWGVTRINGFGVVNYATASFAAATDTAITASFFYELPERGTPADTNIFSYYLYVQDSCDAVVNLEYSSDGTNYKAVQLADSTALWHTADGVTTLMKSGIVSVNMLGSGIGWPPYMRIKYIGSAQSANKYFRVDRVVL